MKPFMTALSVRLREIWCMGSSLVQPPAMTNGAVVIAVVTAVANALLNSFLWSSIDCYEEG